VVRLARKVDSICVHGDTPDCLEIIELVYKTLEKHGLEVGY
jgi:lactam utilization protein B